MDDRLRNARLLAVAALALLLFNFPFLELFGVPMLVAGVPVLWAYLFAVWALVLVLVGWILR